MTRLLNLPDRALFAYGTETVPPQMAQACRDAEALAPGQSAELGRPGAPIAAIDLTRAAPLRFSDLRHPFVVPPMAQDLAHAETQLACLRQHLIKLCGLWAKPQVAFIEAYFDAIRAQVGQHEVALTARVGDLAGLVEPAHWCFAAPMPLPRAHVPRAILGDLPQDGSGAPIRVDILFRGAAGLTALCLSQSTATGRQARDLAALETAGIRVLRQFPPRTGAALLEALGADFTDVTHTIALPQSPFHGMGIPDPA